MSRKFESRFTSLRILSTNLFHVQLCSRFESLDKFGDFGAQSPILPIRALFSQHTDQSFHVDSEVVMADEIVNIGLEPRTIKLTNNHMGDVILKS